MPYDRQTFFDSVRGSLFAGSLTQSQVDGMTYILSTWEGAPLTEDHRWLAYCLATTFHETARTMQPIEEHGHGAHQPYGQPDPVTGQKYYGRGFVQLTWKNNYKRAANELGLAGDDDLVKHPERALDPVIAAGVMFRGMDEAWFRAPNALKTYFNATVDDAFKAREIINGDKSVVPTWSHGVSIGKLIKGYHEKFLSGLVESYDD